MQAYRVKIEVKNSQPLIWRRVLVDGGGNFQDLHEVIQNVLSFGDSHLYMFFLPNHKLKVTNDEGAHEVYLEYLENREQIEATLTALDTPFAKRQLENLRIEVQKPGAMRLAPYFQPGTTAEYLYDFGDSWDISLTAEGILEDYALEYPILLAGEQAAPLEHMGGLRGYQKFFEAYHNPEHPDHVGARQWGDQQGFVDYDSEAIQKRLRAWGE
jgi:hypothetical protein